MKSKPVLYFKYNGKLIDADWVKGLLWKPTNLQIIINIVSLFQINK